MNKKKINKFQRQLMKNKLLLLLIPIVLIAGGLFLVNMQGIIGGAPGEPGVGDVAQAEWEGWGYAENWWLAVPGWDDYAHEVIREEASIMTIDEIPYFASTDWSNGVFKDSYVGMTRAIAQLIETGENVVYWTFSPIDSEIMYVYKTYPKPETIPGFELSGTIIGITTLMFAYRQWREEKE